jgi:uncharacterized protein YndB with AHSA1/START domain
MKWLAAGVGLVSAMALLVYVIGSRLPQRHKASKQATLPVPPEVVWTTLTDVDAYPSWRAGVKRIERLPDRDGRQAWIEHGRHGAITFVLERREPPTLLVVRIADPDLPFGGAWTYDISAVPEGARLTITEDGEVYNPVFRFMSRFVFGHEATLTEYLSDLSKRVAARS